MIYDEQMDSQPYYLSIAVASVFRQPLDYLPPDGAAVAQLQPGMRVQVPFGRRELVGVLLAVKTTTTLPPEKIKHAIAVLDPAPLLSAELISLYHWVSDYYHAGIGEVILNTLPRALRQAKAVQLKKRPENCAALCSSGPELNAEQQQAVNHLQQLQQYQAVLLEGVTGSGKTEVYIQAIAQVLQRGQQALVLVPEIALTPQTVARFTARFNVPVVPLHSALAAGKRAQHWLLTREDMPLLVIGTRSSVFAPFVNLGLIVIDEEHDMSFKQQSGLRYSAKDVAIKRAFDLQIPIVLGSATPSLETYYNVAQRGFAHLRLTQRVAGAKTPTVFIEDLRGKELTSGLTPAVLQRMDQHLQGGRQVLLFLNRRGFAPVMICHHCGECANCYRCDARLVWHKRDNRLHCHHCEYVRDLPPYCEQCQQANLVPVGVGTQRLDEFLQQRYPEIDVIRVDRDSTRRKDALQDKLTVINSGKPAILIGTQMLTKGHHFPDLGLVVIVDADANLLGLDFRAEERFAQQLVQVSGRAGRAQLPGEVVVQTYQPQNDLLNTLTKQGYNGFVTPAMDLRQRISLPPYCFMAMWHAQSKQADIAERFLQNLRDFLQGLDVSVELLGPAPAAMARVKGQYRAQLMCKCAHRTQLNSALKAAVAHMASMPLVRSVRWALDVDPQVV